MLIHLDVQIVSFPRCFILTSFILTFFLKINIICIRSFILIKNGKYFETMYNIFIIGDNFSGFNPLFLYVIIGISLISGILIITSKNPIISVLYLILLFGSISCYLVLVGLKFIGISYIVIYVGAIAVLFLFVIMMINIKLTDILETGYQYTKNIPLALTVSGLFLYEFFNVLPSYINSPAMPIDNSILLSIIKEIVLNLNSFFRSFITSDSLLALSPQPQEMVQVSTHMTNKVFIENGTQIYPLISGNTVANNWPETLISSSTQQIVSVAYSLYTYGAFWFLLLSLILLLAMIAPIYLSRK